jgi:tRNA(Ile)-lysidine synthase
MAPCGPRRRVRPLLGVSRARLRRYLAQNAIPYRTDPSNADPAFLRNRVRERVIPLIEREVNPAARRTLARTAAFFREIEEHLDAAAEEALERIAERSSGKIRLAGAPLLTYDSALRRYVLRAAARELLGGRGPLYSVHIESVLRLLEAGRTGASIELPGGARAQFGGGLVFTRDSAPARAAWGPVPLEVPGDTHLDAVGVVVRSVVLDGMDPASVPRGPQIAAFDLDALLLPLVARSRRPGDRFVPFGARGSRKVQDALVDDKVPRQRRDGVVIVEDGEGILWLAGVRRAARAPVTPSSKRVLTLETVREQR